MLTTTIHCPVCEKPTKHVSLFVDKVVGSLLSCLACFCKPAAQAFFVQKGLVVA
jgi:hypothetical protein